LQCVVITSHEIHRNFKEKPEEGTRKGPKFTRLWCCDYAFRPFLANQKTMRSHNETTTYQEQAYELLHQLANTHSHDHLQQLKDVITQCLGLMLEQGRNADLFKEQADTLMVHFFDLQRIEEWDNQRPKTTRILTELGKANINLEILSDFFADGLEQWQKQKKNATELATIRKSWELITGRV